MPRRLIPEPLAAKVGARIRELRTERGLSIAALAASAGLSKGHLSSVERGLVLITVNTLEVTARALGVPTFVLATFPDEDPLSAVVDLLRSRANGNTREAAHKLRLLAFGPLPDLAKLPKKRTPKKGKKR